MTKLFSVGLAFTIALGVVSFTMSKVNGVVKIFDQQVVSATVLKKVR